MRKPKRTKHNTVDLSKVLGGAGEDFKALQQEQLEQVTGGSPEAPVCPDDEEPDPRDGNDRVVTDDINY